MSLQILIKIFHILGVALGAGGAFMSDVMFSSSVRDGRLSKTEMRFLTIGSRMVWIGVAVLIISGIGLVLMNPERTLGSEKFWVKMTVVGIIIVNGILFHIYHLPHLHKHVDVHFPTSATFVKRIPLLLISGAISGVSWTTAIVLGAMRGLPYSYWQMISVYVGVVLVAVAGVIVFRRRIIKH